MAASRERILNISLRFGTLGTRFLFVFFLAKYLDVASVGYYGLFTATVGYCLYFVGMDYYVFVTREILKAPIDQRGRLLKGQIALSSLLYVALVPVATVLLNKADWPGHLLWWFVPILLLEHLNQEISRLLIAFSEQVSASLVLFVRQGSWVLVVLALMSWDAQIRHLDAVMALWVCAGVSAAALGIWKVRQLQIGGWGYSIDWAWVRRGVAVSAAFLIATLALRGIQTIDRYWLEALVGIEVVGAYVLFMGVSSALVVFLDAGVFSFSYPALIKHNHHKEYALARTKVRHMIFQTLAVCLAFDVVSLLLLPYLLNWIGNPAYQNAVILYPWLLASMTINAVGLVPHYALYAYGWDKPIVYSHLAALPTFILSTLAISQIQPVLAVPSGLLASFTIILVWKTLAYVKLSRSHYVTEQSHHSSSH